MAYERQNWVNGETVATAERMNHIEEGIENISTTSNEKITDLYDGINNNNTNVKVYKRNNLVHLSGVIYFTASPGVWTKLMQLPEGFYGVDTHGVLVEESTGLVRPIVINSNGVVQMTHEISLTPLYAYISVEMIL